MEGGGGGGGRQGGGSKRGGGGKRGEVEGGGGRFPYNPLEPCKLAFKKMNIDSESPIMPSYEHGM